MDSRISEKLKQDEKVTRILRWREALTLLPDERFFEIMRIYLGAIQTPFNKPNLIERLSSIFRKAENQKRIISFLSDFDLRMLSVISIISNANQEKLTDFFSKDFSLSDIYAELLSLNERLLIYSYKNPETMKPVIAINPLLEDALSPYLGLKQLLPEAICVQRNFETSFILTPQFIASFLSYIQANPEMCKNDLSIKKKDLERLETIFPGRQNVLVLLLNALLNLGIVKFGEKSLFIDEKRLLKFANLPEITQYVYLATASTVHLGREGLRLQAQLLIDTAGSVPPEGFTLNSIVNTAFLLSNRKGFESRQGARGTFSRILEARRTVEFAENDSDSASSFGLQNFSGKIIENVINSAVEFGIFSLYGQNANGENIYTRSDIFVNGGTSVTGEKKGLLNINAGTNITIMPGFTLSELIPLIQFMNVVKNSTVTEFEINRKSVSRAFDKNISPDEIFSLLQQYNAFEIPQNLRMNIVEWHKSYSSAMLYKGYVLKVDEKTARIIENNPNVSHFIQLKLSEGIYLLNIPFDSDISSFIESSGLEFMGNVREPEKNPESLDFPLLHEGNSMVQTISAENNGISQENLLELFDEGKQVKAELFKKLRSLELKKQYEDALALRIDKGVILSEEQLSSDTVRLEILEADGMNYAGKVRLVENAIQAGDSLELIMPADREGAVMKSFIGKPISITKHPEDCLLKFQLEPDDEIRFFSISMANRIKLIKTSVFN